MTGKELQTIRIVLIDAHEMMRTGLRMLIEQYAHLEVVGEAATYEATVQLVAHEQPDVIIVDLDLGLENGLDLIPSLRQIVPQSRVLVLTGVGNMATHQEAVRRGAVGLVQKTQAARVLVKAIERVAIGEAWLEPALVANLLAEMSRGDTQLDPEATKIATLTEREHAVVALIGEGLQNKAIGERLSISETTVRHHLTSVFNKLGLATRLELVIYAYRNGLAKLPTRN